MWQTVFETGNAGRTAGNSCGGNKLRILCLCLLSTAAGLLPGGEFRGKPGGRLEQQLLGDAADGRLEQFSLLEAALIASGVRSDDDLSAFRTRWDQHLRRLTEQLPADVSPRNRAEGTLRYLHRHVLTGRYQVDATGVEGTLDHGSYNCVSSTVLYRCLWPAGDSRLAAVSKEHHVYCRLYDDPPVEIQPTARRGWDQAEGREMSGMVPASPGQTQGAGRPGVREISDVQLIAKIYYNRGVALIERQQFAEALQWLQISCRLDSADELARRNTLACINNWALADCAAGRYERAAERLVCGLQLAPDYTPFWDNDLYVHHRWVSELCRVGAYDRALQVLESAHQRRPAAALFSDGRRAVSEMAERAVPAEGR